MADGVAAALERAVAAALLEDLGPQASPAADRTAAATLPASATATGDVVARAAGIVAGIAAVPAVYARLDPAVVVTPRAADGDRVAPGSALASVHGPAAAVLAGERTALNLVIHLSGIATLTSQYVAAVAGTRCVVRDTRKTLPGLRILQKAAVRAGGGVNHRQALVDGLLVKDNHALVAGGVGAAARLALAGADGLPVQVEVDDLGELEEALTTGVRAVLLDNFDLELMAAAVARCRREREPIFVEASGGVTLATVAAIAATGVDAVAVGALTHSAPALDIGLDVTVAAQPGAASSSHAAAALGGPAAGHGAAAPGSAAGER